MATPLSSCNPEDAFGALVRAVGALLQGIDPEQSGLWDHTSSWDAFLEKQLVPVKSAMLTCYQAASEGLLKELLDSHDSLAQTLSLSGPEARDLALAVLRTSEGARHERAMSRLATQWEQASPDSPIHPCVSFAVRAAAFNESPIAAQAAYFYQEWRAGKPASALHGNQSSLRLFLEEQPAELLTPSLHDHPSPFLSERHQG